MVVIADSDIMVDRFWVHSADFFGQQADTPFADNGPFLANLVDTASQRRLQRVETLAQRHVHLAGQRVQPVVLALQVVVKIIKTLVEVGQLVFQAVHPDGDTLEAVRHPVQPAVQLGERLGQPVHHGVNGATDVGDRVVLCLQLGQRFVQPLGQDADLRAVGQLGQPLADRAQRLHRRQTSVDLVERVEDLLLLTLSDLGRPHHHVAHPVEGHGGTVVLVHGSYAFVLGEGRL